MAEFRPFVPNATDFHPEELTDADTLRVGGLNAQGNIVMNTNAITGMADPSSPQDAATKAYVDAIDAGLDPKESVRVATDAALPANTAAGSGVGKTLTADAVGVLTVDGVATVLGDRILVKDETAGADIDHGIYEVTTEGTAGVAFILTRATDADTDAEVTQGLRTFAAEGTQNSSTSWMIITADPITVDTTAIEFTIVGDISALVGGDGIDIAANTISVDLATVSGLEFSAAELRVDVADTNELSIDGSGLNVEGVPLLFNIGAVAVGAAVTAANMDTLTDGSNADALHTHAGATNPQETTDGVGVTIGDALYYSAAGIVSEIDAASANSRKFVGLADATIGAAAAVGLSTEGDLLTVTPAGAPAAGALVYIANGGGLTGTLPSTSGDHVVVVGKMRSTTEVRVGPAQYLGKVA